MGRKDRLKQEARAAKAEAKAANPGEGLTMENNQLSPEETAKVIAKLKEAAKNDVEMLENMQVPELQEKLAKSQSVLDKVEAALKVEALRSEALHKAFAAAGLTVPPKDEAEATPTEISAREAEEAASQAMDKTEDERERLRLEWSRTQAQARRKLAAARVERAHCQAMEEMLVQKGLPVPERVAAAE